MSSNEFNGGRPPLNSNDRVERLQVRICFGEKIFHRKSSTVIPSYSFLERRSQVLVRKVSGLYDINRVTRWMKTTGRPLRFCCTMGTVGPIWAEVSVDWSVSPGEQHGQPPKGIPD